MTRQKRLVQALHRRRLRLGVELRRIEMSRSAYYRQLHSRGHPSLDTAAQIAEGAGIDRRQFLEECGLLD